MGKNSYSPAEVDAVMKDKTLLADRLNDLCESQPEVKGNQLVGGMKSIGKRGGFDGGELQRWNRAYREAKQRMPEVLIASFSGLKTLRISSFQWRFEKHPFSILNQNRWLIPFKSLGS